MVNIMENKNMPTMFIETVTTNINSSNSQLIYDSRNKGNNTKWVTEKKVSIIEKKINGILNLIKKGNKINLYFDLFNNSIEGYIKEKKDEKLIVDSNDEIKEINIDEIKLLNFEIMLKYNLWVATIISGKRISEILI